MRRFGSIATMAAVIAGLALAGCASTKSSSTSGTAASATATTTAPATPAASNAPAAPMERTIVGGIKITDLKIGDGAIAENGMDIQTHYTGWLADGTQFDSSAGGQPLAFRLGAGQVIRGWEEGFKGMRVGGKRRIIVPPAMGYGDRGTPGGPIPPNATLTFEVELIAVH